MADLIEQKGKGHEAQRLLDDEMFKDVLKEVRYAAHRAFERSQNEHDREVAWYMLDAVNRLQRMLVAIASRGKAATKEIDRVLDDGGAVRGITRAIRNRDHPPNGMPWNV
jgi:hypothetical protein